jgi:5' nucleotidase, deoxy (Pyrimidine), cytosolic type C protein (NT5C)
MNLYLDMDDVVADWMGEARRMVHRSWDYGERIPDSDWNKIKARERFYRDLPLKEGAFELVDYCRNLLATEKIDRLAFLTAIPHDDTIPYAVNDKVGWAQRLFPGIPVFIGPYSFDKYKHCRPGDILIDDRHSNCAEWRRAGGHAHEYRNWPSCKIWLEATLKAK